MKQACQRLMKTVLIAMFLALALSGCEPGIHSQANKLSCTEDELIMLEKEFEICMRTEYYASHCYDIAKVAHCSTSADS